MRAALPYMAFLPNSKIISLSHLYNRAYYAFLIGLRKVQ